MSARIFNFPAPEPYVEPPLVDPIDADQPDMLAETAEAGLLGLLAMVGFVCFGLGALATAALALVWDRLL